MESLHRRKHSNGFSFSSKNAYDGVLGGTNKIGAPNRKYRVEEYGEIFGGGSCGSSIPILEVPELNDVEANVFRRSSKIDYEKIFGGFRDEVVAVSHEEVFGGAMTQKSSSTKARSPPEAGYPLQGSDHFNCSAKNQVLSTESFDQSFDRVKLFNMSYHKTSQRSNDGTNGTTHVAQLHAVPGFTRFIDETTPLPKTEESDKPVPSVKSDIHSNRKFDKALEEKRKTIMLDLPNKQTSEGDVKAKSGSNWDRSYSSDKLFNAYEINVKSHHSKAAPASTPSANSHDNQGHFKRSIGSNFTPKNGASEDCSPPFSDEEVDVNSVAAVSLAALKKAIEKAQESIRIAKELMERKKEGLQTYSKPNSKGSLKVKDRREKIIPHESNIVKEKNAEEPFERVAAVSQVFAGMEKKTKVKSHAFAPNYKENEEHLISRKVAGQESEENLESAEECEVATWVSDLASKGKLRTASLAFEQGDGKSNILKSKDKDECKPKVKAAKETLEQQEDIFKKSKAVEETSHWEAMEKRLIADTVEREWEVNVGKFELAPVMHEHEENKKPKITQGDKETTEKQKDFCEPQACEKKLKFEKFDSQVLMENDYVERLNKSQEVVKNEKKQLGTPEQEQIETRVEIVHEREENESRHRRISDDEEIEKRPKEACQSVENRNMLEEACGSESNDMNHQDGLKSAAIEKRLDGVHQPKIDGDRPADAPGGEEREKTPEEEYEWERNNRRPIRGYICVEAENTQKQNDRSMENEKVVEVTWNAVGKMIFDSVCDVDKHGASTNMCESRSQKACRDEVNNNFEKREEVNANKENGRIPGITDTFCEFKDVEKEADLIKVAYKLKKTEVLETTGLFHSAGEGNEIKTKMKDASEAVPSDYNVPEMVEVTQNVIHEMTFDSVWDAGKRHATGIVWESQYACRDEVNNNNADTREEVNACAKNGMILGDTEAFCEFKNVGKEAEVVKAAYTLKKKDVFETAALFEGVTEENEIKNNLKDVTVDLPSDDNAPNFGLNYMNFGQEQIEQKKDQGFELASSLENKTEVLVHESGGNEENFQCCEITCDEEEQENNYKAAHEERECVQNGEKLEASKLPGVAKGKEKTMETREEIQTIRNMEREENFDTFFVMTEKETNGTEQKEVEVKEHLRTIDETNKGERDKTLRRHWEKDRRAVERAIREAQLPIESEWKEKTMEIDEDIKTSQTTEKKEKISNSFVMEKKESQETVQNEVEEKDVGEIDEANKKERIEEGEKSQRRHWEKDRVAVERVIREARERAFAEARERAERASVERAIAQVRQRVMAEAREKLEKVSTSAKSAADKTSVEVKLRAERAAVERATAEARERALEKALSQKATSEARIQPERFATEKFSGASRDNGMKPSFSSADSQRFDGTSNESAQRCKSRLERHQRIMERAANALAEKNMRDVLAQKEQAERNRLAEALDADVKRWSSGKERNLRALLSTLQYILGPDGGWKPISLTDLITTNAVKKAYRKATLYVHPDKLQQRGASIRQKYICEKVFDLLKAAWNRFNSEER